MAGVFVPAPGCFHLEVFGVNGNSRTAMDIGLDFTQDTGSELTYATCLTIAETARGLWASEMTDVLSDAYLLLKVRCSDLTTQNSPAADADDGATTGALAVPHCSPQLAAVLPFKTARRGPSGRGRIFLGCLTEAQINNEGQLEPAAVTNIADAFGTDFMAGFISALSSISPEHVVLSRYHVVTSGEPPVPRSTAIISPVVGGYSCDPIVHNQRRRVPRT